MSNPFPSLDKADEDGLLAIGGNLSTELLLIAYTQGIFPWPFSERQPIAWFSPDPRGVIESDKIHIPKSFKRFLNQHPYKVSFNTRFNEVIEQCSKIPRVGQESTWITKEMIAAYKKLFQDGFAYSVEITDDDKLVGGLYGVCIGEFFSGESMFHLKSNTSKLALYSILRKLQQNKIKFLDTQMVTPVTEMFGAHEISRDEFVNQLKNYDLNRKIHL